VTQELTLTDFPPVATTDWNAAILRDQKGAPPQSRIYYRAEDLRGLEYLDAAPGRFPYTRGTRLDNAWRIRELVRDPAEARTALDGGAEEICFVLAEQKIAEVLDALPLDRCAVHFEAGVRAAELLAVLMGRSPVRGSVDYQPLGDWERSREFVPRYIGTGFRPITVRAHRFSEAGSTLVQELGYGLAEAVEILAQLTDRGLAVDDVARSMTFSFAIGPSYFQEIAKLRAARTLWARAIESFHPADAQAGTMTICARTSHWSQTIYDPQVNLLRSTTEAMAAAIGGVDAIQVEPFDETYRTPDRRSHRLARSTQLILKREAWLDRVTDPAAGSYYLEVLTDSLACEAWGVLRQVESAGGFEKYSVSGALDREIAKARAEAETALSTRRVAVVGTNRYPNPQEYMLPRIEHADPAPRAARLFEEIRLRTERHAVRTGQAPRVLLLEGGDSQMRKARAGFCADFFGCAGFAIERSEVLAGDPDLVVLCSSDREYATLAPRVLRQLHEAGKSTPVLVAGNPTDSAERLRQAGVADFVHIGSNAVEVLRGWQERLGVRD
jgi:methylmalonyl-CoA mutase